MFRHMTPMLDNRRRTFPRCKRASAPAGLAAPYGPTGLLGSCDGVIDER